MARGKFIVLEGIEGSGKSTQAKLLYEALLQRGEKCILTFEPTDSQIGKMIRELLKAGNKMDIRTLQLLFVADRSEHIENLVKPKLEEGYTVITDRYAPSTIAYGASFGKKLGLKMSYLLNIHKPFLKPDMVMLIDISPELSAARLASRVGVKERFDEMKSLKSLKKSYDRISKKYHPETWKIIDGSRDIESVKADVLKAYDQIQRVD